MDEKLSKCMTRLRPMLDRDGDSLKDLDSAEYTKVAKQIVQETLGSSYEEAEQLIYLVLSSRDYKSRDQQRAIQ